MSDLSANKQGVGERTRKPKRIAHPKQKAPDVDDDLKELAKVLDERRLEHNREGWFSLPWNSGYYAGLCGLLAFRVNHDDFESQREEHIHDWLQGLYESSQPTDFVTKGGVTYFEAGDLLQGIDMSGAASTESVSPLLYAALRCIQVFTSHSSGGGEVYNILLKLAFERCQVPDHLFEECVLEARCLDAIGTTSSLKGDAYDRSRRAFLIAWKRGLFHAAYSLPPVVKTTIVTTVGG